jgi:hypothetical protein
MFCDKQYRNNTTTLGWKHSAINGVYHIDHLDDAHLPLYLCATETPNVTTIDQHKVYTVLASANAPGQNNYNCFVTPHNAPEAQNIITTPIATPLTKVTK